MCNDNQIFWMFVYLAPRVTHDATHMRFSKFFKKLIRRRLLQEPSINIEGETLKPDIIGDSIYPLLQQIQKPFNAKLFRKDDEDAFDKEGSKLKIPLVSLKLGKDFEKPKF